MMASRLNGCAGFLRFIPQVARALSFALPFLGFFSIHLLPRRECSLGSPRLLTRVFVYLPLSC